MAAMSFCFELGFVDKGVQMLIGSVIEMIYVHYVDTLSSNIFFTPGGTL